MDHQQNNAPAHPIIGEGKPSRRYVATLMSGGRYGRRAPALLFALLIGIAGVVLLLRSFAEHSTIVYSHDPNDVVVQYNLPHKEEAINTANLSPDATAQPFTLYGNGLLICGHSNPSAFTVTGANQQSPTLPTLPTSVTLNQDDVQMLLQQISDTGFFTLQKEYYRQPVTEEQDVVRVNLQDQDHYVMYYNDVPAPAAYSATLRILQNYCSRATSPYVSNNVVLKSLKNANPKTQPVESAPAPGAPAAQIVNNSLAAADASRAKAQKNPVDESGDLEAPGEASQVISGADAQALTNAFATHPHQYIQKNGAVYEVSIEPVLPTVKNQLQVDYRAIRQNAQGLGAKLKHLVMPTAEAASSTPLRIVVLLAQGGGSTQNEAEAQTRGQAIHDWYCNAVGSCYNYVGVSVMTGSQTESYYTTCHGTDPCSGDPLLALLYNVSEMDKGTIYSTNFDTLLVTGWDTGELRLGYCGYGYLSSPLAAVDYYEPSEDTVTSGSFCQPGHDAAHELGHTFGLNHTGNGTLMDGSPYTQYASHCDIADSLEPTCVLDSGQATSLKTNAYFSSTTWQPGWATTASRIADLNSNGRSCLESAYATYIVNYQHPHIVQQYSCGKSAYEQWNLVASNSAGYFQVEQSGSVCAFPAYGSTGDGAAIWLGPCNSSDGSQQWRPVATSTAGYYQLVNQYSGKCMQITNNSTANSTGVEQDTCSTLSGQRFSGNALTAAATH